MAYRFKLKEDLRDGVRRIAGEQIERVLQAPRKGADRVGWVHEARKTMKRTRALLRCVRSGLPDRRFREENAALAEIARGLSGLRDRDVMADTIARLAGQDDGLDEALSVLSTRLHMAASTDAEPELAARSADALVRRALKALEKARERLMKLDVAGALVETVGTGLRSSQRAGRDALARLTVDASDDGVHDLRKVVQTYQRQQTLVYAVWPEICDVRIEAARELAQLLGEAQDFAVLAATAQTISGDLSPDETERLARVTAACHDRQAMIRDIALPMAARLYASRPSAVARELEESWAAAVRLSAVRRHSASGKAGAANQPKRTTDASGD